MEKKKKSWAWYWRHALAGEAIALDISNYDWHAFPLFDCVKNEINYIINNTTEKQAWGYGYPGGTSKFRKLIIEHESLIEKTEFVDKNIIICGNGTTGILNFMTQILAKEYPNKKILYPLPSYDGMKKSIEFNNINAKFFNMSEENDFKLTYADVEKAYDEDVVAILISNPGNPVCKFIEPVEIKKICDFCISKNMYIIYDAIFEESCISVDKKVEIFNYCNDYDKLIKIKGFGKDFPHISDFRIGWCICKNDDLRFKLFKLSEMTNSNNSIFLESVSTKIMQCKNALIKNCPNDNEEMNFIKQYNEYSLSIKTTLSEAIKLLENYNDIIEKVPVPDGGNVLFIKIKEDVCKVLEFDTDFDLLDFEFEHARIFFTPGSEYGLDEKRKWFRVTVSKSKKEFLDHLTTLCEILKVAYYEKIN